MQESQSSWTYDTDRPIRQSPNSASYMATHEIIAGLRGIITFFHVTDEEKEEVRLRIRHVNETIHLHPKAHPYIAKIVDFGMAEQRDGSKNPFVVEEYIEGVSLDETYSKHNTMPPKVALPLCRQMISALQFMHARDICHFGVCFSHIIERKPASPENQTSHTPAPEPVFVLTGWKFDRPAYETYALEDGPYLAPEMFHATTFGQPGERSDLYALAVVLHKALTGKLPVGQANDGRYRMTLQHVPEHPSVKALPRPLRRVFLKALSKQQSDRYQHSSEFLEEFEKACQRIRPDGENIADKIRQVLSRHVSRRTAIKAGIALASAATLLVAMYEITFGSRHDRPKAKAPVPQLGDLLLPLPFRQHNATVRSAMPSPDGSKIASGDDSGKIMLWSAATGYVFWEDPLMHERKPIADVTWSPSSQFFASDDNFGGLVLWGVQERAIKYYSLPASSLAVAWGASGDHLIAAGGDRVYVFDDPVGHKLDLTDSPYTGHTDVINALAISPDSVNAVSVANDGTAQIWAIESATNQLDISCEPSEQPVELSSVAYSPDGRWIAIGSEDKSVQIWDVANRRFASTYYHDKAVRSIAWSPDSRSIASGGDDNVVHLCNIDHNGHATLYFTYTGHHDNVLSVAWLDEKSVVSAGGKEVHIWRARL